MPERLLEVREIPADPEDPSIKIEVDYALKNFPVKPGTAVIETTWIVLLFAVEDVDGIALELRESRLPSVTRTGSRDTTVRRNSDV